MICERCGHEQEPREHLYGTTSYCAHMPEDCIANLRADLARSRKMELDAETRACAAEERAARAQAQCAVLRAALERLYQATVTVDAHNRDAAYGARDALTVNPGDLLTAVRRLIGAARIAADETTSSDVRKMLHAVLAYPVLAGLRDAP